MCQLTFELYRNPIDEDLVGLHVTAENIQCVAYYYGFIYDPEYKRVNAGPRGPAILKPARIGTPREFGRVGDRILQRITHGGEPLFYKPETVAKHLRPYPEPEETEWESTL